MVDYMDYFIQTSIKRPGRVHKYLMREYGLRAFNQDGTEKVQYLNMAERRARKEHNRSLESALVLAKRLKGYAKEKEKAVA